MTAAELALQLALQAPIILIEELCPFFQSAGYKGRKLFWYTTHVFPSRMWCLRPPESHVGGCGRLSCLQVRPYILCLQQVSASPLHGRCMQESSSSLISKDKLKFKHTYKDEYKHKYQWRSVSSLHRRCLWCSQGDLVSYQNTAASENS